DLSDGADGTGSRCAGVNAMRFAFAALLVASTVTLVGRGFSASARETNERATADAPKRLGREGGQPRPGDLERVALQHMAIPSYQVDPFWPKPLPNHWLVGAVAGVAVDAKDHVWITHRPSTLQPNETRSFWRAAPPVVEFDQDGHLVSSWGGPGGGYEWPQLEPGLYVADPGTVVLGG